MTDAREIIAKYLCTMAAKEWSAISPYERALYRTAAHGIIATLADAGFRILGPDEVDPVTVERIAEFAKDKFERDFDLPIGWRDQFVAAIRAMEKEDSRNEHVCSS